MVLLSFLKRCFHPQKSGSKAKNPPCLEALSYNIRQLAWSGDPKSHKSHQDTWCWSKIPFLSGDIGHLFLDSQLWVQGRITRGFDIYGPPISDFGLRILDCLPREIPDRSGPFNRGGFHVFETIITDGFDIYGHNWRTFLKILHIFLIESGLIVFSWL